MVLLSALSHYPFFFDLTDQLGLPDVQYLPHYRNLLAQRNPEKKYIAGNSPITLEQDKTRNHRDDVRQ